MRPSDGFPTSWGSSRASIYPHAGPASYTQVVVGAQATAGDLTQSPECGLKYFDDVQGGLTDSGRFLVVAFPLVSSIGPVGTQGQTYGLKWISQVTATVGGQAQTAGTEAVAATDLSGEIVRLLAVGPK